MANTVSEPIRGDQGTSYRVQLDAGGVATVSFKNRSLWGFKSRGSVGYRVSWSVFPGDGGTVAAEHSLLPEGDHWSDDPDSPFDEDNENYEEAPIARLRFTANTAAAEVHLLAPMDLDIAVS